MVHPVAELDPLDRIGWVLRLCALGRLKRRRNFFTQLVVYVAVDALLVVVWAFGNRNFFWPIFVIVGWGILAAANASRVFRSDDDEDKIRREMDALKKAAMTWI